MNGVLDVIWHGLRDSCLMAYQVWWALVFGFAISAIVQSWVPRQRIEHAMSGDGARPVAIATGLGAASSSCSYAAIAIAKSLFQKGASGVAALAFQFASTNLVWELGLVLWVLIGWQFTVAEYVGGLIMIVIMTLTFRVFVPRRIEQQAREQPTEADTGHQHHMAGEQMSLRQKLTSARAWSDVAHNFRGDWQMLYEEGRRRRLRTRGCIRFRSDVARSSSGLCVDSSGLCVDLRRRAMLRSPSVPRPALSGFWS